MLNTTKLIVGCLAVIAITNSAKAAESIAYRLAEAKEMHFDDARKAEQHLVAVKKLGCEAQLDSHSGHTDVTYRAAKWQVMEVATDKLAHQWEGWLKKAGFETIHGHASVHGKGHDAHDGHDHSSHHHAGHNHAPGKAEEVAYQLPQWKPIHIEDKRQLPEMVALMKGLGCEVKSENHDGHADLSVHCAKWKYLEFESHKDATTWEGWLKKNGFNTRHEN